MQVEVRLYVASLQILQEKGFHDHQRDKAGEPRI